MDPISISNSLIGNGLVGANLSATNNPLEGLSEFADLATRLEELNTAADERAESVGKEFESVFVSLLLKEMRNTLDTGEGGLFGSEQSDTFGGMFDQFMGQHLSEASPLGIADAIKSYLKNAAT